MLIEWYGARRAFEVVMELGGIRHYVPSTSRKYSGGQLTSFFSEQELKPLIEEFGGLYIKMPVARRFCIEFLYWVEEKSLASIARVLRVTDDTVLKCLGSEPPVFLKSVAVRQSRERGGGQ